MIKTLFDALVACKYDVSKLPQEKRPDRKIVLRLKAIDLEVSDSQLYNMPVYVELEWNDSDVFEIPDYIATLCEDVERYLYTTASLGRGSFRWDKIDITPKAGSQYNIILTAMYKEEVQI